MIEYLFASAALLFVAVILTAGITENYRKKKYNMPFDEDKKQIENDIKWIQILIDQYVEKNKKWIYKHNGD